MFKRFGKKPEEIEITNIETSLARAFIPLQPRKEFIDTLEYRLAKINLAPVNPATEEKKQKLFAISSSVVGVLFMTFTGLRALFSFIGVFGITYQYFTKKARLKQSNMPAT